MGDLTRPWPPAYAIMAWQDEQERSKTAAGGENGE